MRIVSIEKSRRGKYEISSDEGEKLTVTKEVLIDFGLRRGDIITFETVERVRNAQMYHDAYVAAVRLINYRMRTTKELERRLHQKGVSQDIGAKVIGRLTDLGLVDDSKFAEAFIAGKLASKPMGKRELGRRLREKGIGKELAESTISSVGSDDVQFGLAIRAADSKLPSLRRFGADKQREKLTAFLARRGFDWDVIRRVIRKVLKDNSDAIDL